MSEPEEVLAGQLRMLKIPYEREYRFAPPRRWRADFLIPHQERRIVSNCFEVTPALLVEVDGGAFIAGRHSRGIGVEKDAEKQSAAAILGYRVIRCTPRQVESGECVSWIERALGVREKAA